MPCQSANLPQTSALTVAHERDSRVQAQRPTTKRKKHSISTGVFGSCQNIFIFCLISLTGLLRFFLRIARASVQGTNLVYQAVVGLFGPSSCFTALGRGCNGCITRRWGPKIETSPQSMICRATLLGAITSWIASQVAVAIGARGRLPCLSC